MSKNIKKIKFDLVKKSNEAREKVREELTQKGVEIIGTDFKATDVILLNQINNVLYEQDLLVLNRRVL